MYIFFRHHLMLTGLLAGLMILSGTACKKTGVEAPPAPGVPPARLMILQPNPYLHDMDMYSVYMDTPRLNAQPIVWPGLMQYVNAPSGNRWLTATLADQYAQYYMWPFYFRPGASYTVYSADQIRAGGSNFAFVEDDLSDPAPGYAKIRMIQGCRGSSVTDAGRDITVDWMIHNGGTLAKRLGYRSNYEPSQPGYKRDTTSFRQLPVGDYWFDVKNSDAPNTFRASLQGTLKPGGVYTLFSYGIMQEDRSLIMGLTLIQNK